MELSIYFIKPEAFDSKIEIQRIISASGLTIILSKERILLPPILNKIYPEFQNAKSYAMTHYFSDTKFIVGVVSGKNAAKKLVEVCGDETNPVKCKEGTIRKLFGIQEPQFNDGIEYFLNAIHRSENKEDAIKDFELLRKYTSIFKDYSFL